MTIQELEQEIKAMPYTISGSQGIGWLITYKDGRTTHVPAGIDYQRAIKLADTVHS